MKEHDEILKALQVIYQIGWLIVAFQLRHLEVAGQWLPYDSITERWVDMEVDLITLTYGLMLQYLDLSVHYL